MLKICSIALAFCIWSVGAEEGGSGITIDANSVAVSIKGEVKNIISVEFGEEKRELLLFEDNGKETDKASRTFAFEVKIMTGRGAKLKLEGKDGLSFDSERRYWKLSKVGGSSESEQIVHVEFLLYGMSKEKQLNQRAWDGDGCCYTFKENDGIGEWKIIANPISEITNEESGIYKGSLKVSVVAA